MAVPHRRLDDHLTAGQVADLETVLTRSRSVGFLGDGPIGDHLAHALGFVDAVAAVSAPPARFLDLGSGGGVPGLVLALVWAEAEGVLLDAQSKRCVILNDAVVQLGLGERISVARGRAEELGREPVFRGAFDVVTARSFGPPAVVAECAAPFLRIGGILVVSEPPVAVGRWPSESLSVLGIESQAPFGGTNGVGEGTDPLARFQILRQTGPLPDRYPRRVGIPTKRPLF